MKFMQNLHRHAHMGMYMCGWKKVYLDNRKKIFLSRKNIIQRSFERKIKITIGYILIIINFEYAFKIYFLLLPVSGHFSYLLTPSPSSCFWHFFFFGILSVVPFIAPPATDALSAKFLHLPLSFQVAYPFLLLNSSGSLEPFFSSLSFEQLWGISCLFLIYSLVILNVLAMHQRQQYSWDACESSDSWIPNLKKRWCGVSDFTFL